MERCYNAPAAVVAGCLLGLATDVAQAPNQKQQAVPMREKRNVLPEDPGEGETLPADTGSFNRSNVQACVAAEIDPLLAIGQQAPHPPLAERVATMPPPMGNLTPV